MKTKSGKLPLRIVISALIIAAGLIMFFALGFNVSTELKDRTSVSVTYDAYITVDEDRLDVLEDAATATIEAKGLKITDTVFTSETSGGTIEFFFDKDTDSAVLNEVASAVLNDVTANASLSGGTYETAVHTYVAQHFYTYVWRGAIAMCAGILTAFVYVSIRFKLNMGVSVAITSLLSTVLVLALTIICRIPVGVTYIGALGFALVYSLLVNIVAMIYMRSTYKDENVKILSAEEQLEKACASFVKPVLKIGAASLLAMVMLFAATIFAAEEIAYFAVVGAICVIVNQLTVNGFMPAIYAPMKAASDKRAAYKASPEYKEKKRAAKGSDKDID